MSIYTTLSSKSHNPHYLKRYIKFIEYCRNNLIEDHIYTEKHHICPKALFPEYESFIQHPWNMIILTFDQHIIAHHILALTFNNRSTNSAYSFLLKNSKNTKENRIKSKLISLRLSEQMKTNNPIYCPIAKAKMIESLRIHRLNPDHCKQETRNLISAKLSGIPKPSGFGENLSALLWCNDGKRNKRVKVIPDGFVPGKLPCGPRKDKNKSKGINKNWVTCFDKEVMEFVRIEKEKFWQAKGIRYITARSKEFKSIAPAL